MARLGKLDEYDEKEQNFESYLERFEHFVTANDIKEEKKLAVFLSVIGARTYEVLKSLVVPAVPGDKSFEEVTVLLTKHYSPSCSVIAECCKFNKRAQEEQESVEDFIVALKHLARKCDFGLFLQDALRDRLVAGIRREETQLALFAEDSLTFEKACKIALDREQAAPQTALLHAEASEDTAHPSAPMSSGPFAVPPLGVPGANESANQQLPAPESPTPGTAAPGSSNQPDPAPTAELPILRRSARVRHPPNRYQPSDFRS
ncbi:uncharacterized protein LOC119455976 [Dermacentor silvarum]|uniref:uncharacterized protein LOC119455976 n=1 Tax=Dermacentor silvarum TaxID=543639 RepID=UPI0021013DBB|nr:uncharacterized protein LOC119455976 [Dermacentor silvarum]